MKKIFCTMVVALAAMSAMANLIPGEAISPKAKQKVLIGTTIDGTNYYMNNVGELSTACTSADYVWELEPALDGNFFFVSTVDGNYIGDYTTDALSNSECTINKESSWYSKANSMILSIDKSGIVTRVKRFEEQCDNFTMQIANNGGTYSTVMRKAGDSVKWKLYKYTDENENSINKLTDLLASMNQFLANASTGDEPGCMDAAALENLKSKVQKYEIGAQTQDAAKKAIDDLQVAYEACLASVKKMETGVWYTITYNGLYLSEQDYKTVLSKKDWGQSSQWRFIDLHNGAYAIQNRKTGATVGADKDGSYWLITSLYTNTHCQMLPEYATDGTRGIYLNEFNWRNVYRGYAESYEDNALTTHVLGYGNYGSAAIITQAEKDNEVDDLTYPTVYTQINRFRPNCLPMAITNITCNNIKALKVDGLFVHNGAAYVGMHAIDFEHGETIAAGEPYIYQMGDTDAPIDLKGKSDSLYITYGSEISRTAITTNAGLVGLMRNDSTTVNGPVIVADLETGRFTVVKDETKIPAFRGYIEIKNVRSNPTCSILAPIDNWDDALGITTTSANETNNSSVYSINGILKEENATRSNLHKLGKGIYILNGEKFIVK